MLPLLMAAFEKYLIEFITLESLIPEMSEKEIHEHSILCSEIKAQISDLSSRISDVRAGSDNLREQEKAEAREGFIQQAAKEFKLLAADINRNLVKPRYGWTDHSLVERYKRIPSLDSEVARLMKKATEFSREVNGPDEQKIFRELFLPQKKGPWNLHVVKCHDCSFQID